MLLKALCCTMSVFVAFGMISIALRRGQNR